MIMANHSSVHLLQAALIKVLGDHVGQAGSYVCQDYARFDFTHYEKVSLQQLNEVERLVNEYICTGYDVKTEIMSIDDAKNSGAIALFDEKYGDTVRVVSMGNVSKELCGGTHVDNTSRLGSFKIVLEESIGSGIRRIESQTGLKAYDSFKDYHHKLEQLKDELNLKNIEMIYDRVLNIENDNKQLNNELKTIKEKLLNEEANSLINKAIDNGKYKYLLLKLDNYEGNLKDYAISIRNKLDNGFIFVVNQKDDKLSMVAGAGSKAIDEGIDCGQIISTICKLASGKGGGKKDLAQGGGSNYNPDNLLKEVEKLLNS